MNKRNIYIVSVCFIFALTFFTALFLTTAGGNLSGVSVPKSDVPYKEVATAENMTLLVKLPDNQGFVVKLDFKERLASAMVLRENDFDLLDSYGFSVSETLTADYSFIMHFVDILGGLDINIGGATERYTGVQICNLLAVYKEDIALKKAMLCSLFEKISKYGFSTDALSCIIEESDTTLCVPDCYGWETDLPYLLARYNILNKG